MRAGIDLVYLPEFKQRLDNIGGASRVFVDSELASAVSAESLAGIFAAKEAFMKAVGKKIDWRDVWVERESSGEPVLRTVLAFNNFKIHVSISHAGDYATAMVVIE